VRSAKTESLLSLGLLDLPEHAGLLVQRGHPDQVGLWDHVDIKDVLVPLGTLDGPELLGELDREVRSGFLDVPELLELLDQWVSIHASTYESMLLILCFIR
jgi:hypothetical protein